MWFVRRSKYLALLARWDDERIGGDAAREANAQLIERNGQLLLKIEQLEASRPGRGAQGRYVAVRQGGKIVRVPVGEQG